METVCRTYDNEPEPDCTHFLLHHPEYMPFYYAGSNSDWEEYFKKCPEEKEIITLSKQIIAAYGQHNISFSDDINKLPGNSENLNITRLVYGFLKAKTFEVTDLDNFWFIVYYDHNHIPVTMDLMEGTVSEVFDRIGCLSSKLFHGSAQFDEETKEVCYVSHGYAQPIVPRSLFEIETDFTMKFILEFDPAKNPKLRKTKTE